MKISNSTIGMVAESVAKSKSMLSRAHQQIARSRAGLETLAEVTNRSRHIGGGFNRS